MEYSSITLIIENMPQYPRLGQSAMTSQRRQGNSLRFKQKDANTLSYTQSIGLNLPISKLRCKKVSQQANSFQTCQSQNTSSAERELSLGPNRKIKVQLCKNFVEKGYCPYENRCKFAHGIEQLRAKDTHGTSELYRTRKCKVFYERHECKFGERCNFMHESRKISDILTHNRKLIRDAIHSNFKEIEEAMSIPSGSRLLNLLQI